MRHKTAAAAAQILTAEGCNQHCRYNCRPTHLVTARRGRRTRQTVETPPRDQHVRQGQARSTVYRAICRRNFISNHSCGEKAWSCSLWMVTLLAAVRLHRAPACGLGRHKVGDVKGRWGQAGVPAASEAAASRGGA